MITGKLLLYWYNSLENNKPGLKRNRFTIKPISVGTPKEFQHEIETSLDSIPPGKGYVLVGWNKKFFICEKDINNPEVPYVRHEVKYHPLASHVS